MVKGDRMVSKSKKIAEGIEQQGNTKGIRIAAKAQDQQERQDGNQRQGNSKRTKMAKGVGWQVMAGGME